MPKKNHTNLKIIAATSMTIFSLACVFVSTIAWFAANRTVNGNGNGFEIGNESGLIKSVSLHEYLPNATGSYQFKEESAVTYTASGGGFKKDPDNFTDLSIGTYDSLVDQVYAVLYVIEIDKSALTGNSVTLQITTSTAEKDNLFYQENGQYKNMLKKEGNPMSSIVQFASYSFSQPVYRFGGTAAPSPSFKTFKTATGYSATIDQPFIDGSGTSSFSYLELIVAYNNQTIEELLDINEENETIWSLDYNTIQFTQDWRISVI